MLQRRGMPALRTNQAYRGTCKLSRTALIVSELADRATPA
jgi:hypothetical protein